MKYSLWVLWKIHYVLCICKSGTQKNPRPTKHKKKTTKQEKKTKQKTKPPQTHYHMIIRTHIIIEI